MQAKPSDIHPVSNRMLKRSDKEVLLKQEGMVLWLCGLSGSGKSTMAIALEQKLYAEGFYTQVLDGDNIRTGLNNNLDFSDEDRRENIRRVAEVAKLMAHAGAVVICSFITPLKEFRELARRIVGKADLLEVYVKASLKTCESRDVKGLYVKVREGKVTNFTGKDSGFEEPATPDLVLNTEIETVSQSLDRLYDLIRPSISAKA